MASGEGMEYESAEVPGDEGRIDHAARIKAVPSIGSDPIHSVAGTAFRGMAEDCGVLNLYGQIHSASVCASEQRHPAERIRQSSFLWDRPDPIVFFCLFLGGFRAVFTACVKYGSVLCGFVSGLCYCRPDLYEEVS